MRLILLILLCVVLCALCTDSTDEKDFNNHRRIVRQATTKKAATTTKKPATTTKKGATTTKKGATTTKKAGATTKKAATTTRKAGATTKKTTTFSTLKPIAYSNTFLKPVPQSLLEPLMDYEDYESSDYSYNMYYDYGDAEPFQSSKSPVVSTTRRPSNSRPSNSRPSRYPSWGYYSFQRWFNPRRYYRPRNTRNLFNFMSRPSYYRYFRRN